MDFIYGRPISKALSIVDFPPCFILFCIGILHYDSVLTDSNKSSQSRKSEFRVFSIVRLNTYNFCCTQSISTK